MHALQKRFERWEYHNQQKLEWLAVLGRQQAQKQTRNFVQLLSFLLYLAYRGGGLLMIAHRALWVPPKDLDRRISEAGEKRLQLMTLPNQWLK